MAEENTTEQDQGSGPSEEVVERAKRMGWTPREQFRGDPDRFVDADKFVERAETELPILLERNRTLDRKLTATQSQLTGLQGELSEVKTVLVEFRDFASKSEERAYNKAKMELLEAQRTAVAAADVAGYDRAQKDLDDLEKTKVKTTPVVEKPEVKEPGVPVEVRQFVADNNAWYDKDPELTADAIALHDSVHKQHPDWTLEENLKEVKRKLIRMHPEKLEVLDPQASKREKPSTTTVSGQRETLGSGNRTKAKGYNDLPEDAKKACDRFVKQIAGYKQEDYVKQYFAGEQ